MIEKGLAPARHRLALHYQAGRSSTSGLLYPSAKNSAYSAVMRSPWGEPVYCRTQPSFVKCLQFGT